MEKHIYIAPEAEIVTPHFSLMDGTVPVHWSEENEGEIEANEGIWEEESSQPQGRTSNFLLWDEE